MQALTTVLKPLGVSLLVALSALYDGQCSWALMTT
jgi:hypothetical protein